MDRSTAFSLVRRIQSQDDIGQWVEELEFRECFGQVGSVSAQEFFAGGQNGHKPELRIVMFAYDYCGEREARVGSEIFTIYRTYRGRNDMIELYLEARVGNENEENECG